MKDLAKSLLLTLAVSLLTVVIGEAVLRHWFEPFPAAEEERFLVPDTSLGWANRPNFDSVFTSEEKGYRGHVTFDPLGVRENGAAHLSNPELTVVVVGDSTSAGLEVDNEKTFSALLEQKMRASGLRANVWNAGVRGYGTDQSYLNLLRLAPSLKPNVVIYLSCGNDFSDNLTIKNWYRPYSKPAYILKGDELTLTNEPVQDFPKGEYAFISYTDAGSKVETGFLKPGGAQGWLRDHSAVYGLLETFYYVHMSNTVFRVVKRNAKIERAILAGLMKKMKTVTPRFYVTSFTKEKGGDGIGYDEVQAIANEVGVPFLDTRAHFAKGPRYDYKVDSHWNELGHAQEAEALWQELTAQRAFAERVTYDERRKH